MIRSTVDAVHCSCFTAFAKYTLNNASAKGLFDINCLWWWASVLQITPKLEKLKRRACLTTVGWPMIERRTTNFNLDKIILMSLAQLRPIKSGQKFTVKRNCQNIHTHQRNVSELTVCCYREAIQKQRTATNRRIWTIVYFRLYDLWLAWATCLHSRWEIINETNGRTWNDNWEAKCICLLFFSGKRDIGIYHWNSFLTLEINDMKDTCFPSIFSFFLKSNLYLHTFFLVRSFASPFREPFMFLLLLQYLLFVITITSWLQSTSAFYWIVFPLCVFVVRPNCVHFNIIWSSRCIELITRFCLWGACANIVRCEQCFHVSQIVSISLDPFFSFGLKNYFVLIHMKCCRHCPSLFLASSFFLLSLLKLVALTPN